MKTFITLLFCSLFVYQVTGQDIDPPLSPRLDMVTVDPGTGFAILRWLPSPSPDAARYVIYTYAAGTATAIDTVFSPFVYYILSKINTNYQLHKVLFQNKQR